MPFHVFLQHFVRCGLPRFWLTGKQVSSRMCWELGGAQCGLKCGQTELRSCAVSPSHASWEHCGDTAVPARYWGARCRGRGPAAQGFGTQPAVMRGWTWLRCQPLEGVQKVLCAVFASLICHSLVPILSLTPPCTSSTSLCCYCCLGECHVLNN